MSDAQIEAKWQAFGDWVQHLVADPTVQGIVGTLAVGALVLFVLIRET